VNPKPSTVLASGVIVVSLTLGILALAVGRTDTGVSLEQDGAYVRIASVAHDSRAQLDGFEPGMIVTSVNGVDLLRLPQEVYPDPAEPAGMAPSAGPSPAQTEPTTSSAAASPGASSDSGGSPALPSSPTPTASSGPRQSSEPSPTSAPGVGGGTISNPVASPAAGDDGSGEPVAVLDPPVPTVVPIDQATFDVLATAAIVQIEAITPYNLEHGSGANGWLTANLYDGFLPGPPQELSFELGTGCLILALGLWLVASGRAGPTVRPLALPLSLAAAIPFLGGALLVTWFAPLIVVVGVLLPLGMIPLAYELTTRIPSPEFRRASFVVTAATATGAVVVGVMRVGIDASQFSADVARYLLVGAIPIVPRVAAALPFGRVSSLEPGATSPVRSAELTVASATPLMSLASVAYLNPVLLPLSAWLAGIAVAGRLTVRPLTRLLRRTQLQRDLVVAATEAERARVAADIHDDALQELTLLVRRLDGTGDTEGAAMGRQVIERLRAICGDLRLPLLDDLGVAPALDWLVQRIEAVAGGEVRLERSDGVRPPADVELAFFRVAQEALSNAARHGQPPIVVRYQASDNGVVLSVDDAGPGIPAGAADVAEQAGRFGLLNMRQRADQIGAILDVRPWPGGGTHVGLQWRPH